MSWLPDQVFEQKGVKIIVDAKAHIHLDGTELDFVKEPQRGFQFNKPECQGRMFVAKASV